MHKIVTPAIAALAFAVSATSAWAEQRSVQVDYSDLDLSSDTAVALLEGRIRTAVRTVCGAPDHRNVRAAQSWKQCREGAQASAYRQLAAILNMDQGIALATMLTRDNRG